MDIFNKEKVARLEAVIAMLKQDVELYKGRCAQLEGEAKNTKDLELKVKCLQMYCDDDEAIDELMTSVKEKDKSEKKYSVDALIESGVEYQRRMCIEAQAQAQGRIGQAQIGQLGMGALGGMFGVGLSNDYR